MKTIKTNWNYFKYLFLLGPMLSIMGITAGLVAGRWKPLPLALLITGIVIIGLWFLFSSSAQNFVKSRSTQVGTNALVATLAMLAILALINFMAVRYAKRVDLTESQLFTLAPESQQVVRSLKQPVKAWVFIRNQNPDDKELLENYRRYGSQFNFEFVDPELKPELAEKFRVQSSKNGEVYLESGANRQLVEQLTEGEKISETKLTNGIQKIISDRTDKVYFLQGHGERPLEAVQGGFSQALSFLQQKNYTTQALTLTNQVEIPKDAAVVVIAGPKRALFEGEVNFLKDYLSSGGSLLVMADPNTDPGLDKLLKDWGVKLDKGLAIDASGKGRLVGLGPETIIVTRYGDHPITKNFGNGISFYPIARPVEVTPIVGIEQSTLIITEEQSWEESTPDKQPLEFNPQSDRQGPLTLGVALNRVFARSSTPVPSTTPSASPTPNSAKSPGTTPSSNTTPTPTTSPVKVETDKKPVQARLIVLGNSEFASDGLFDQQLNGDVFLNSVSWLSKRDEQTLSIRPKEGRNRRINMSPSQATLLGWTALLIVPLLGFTTAALVWWRRR